MKKKTLRAAQRRDIFTDNRLLAELTSKEAARIAFDVVELKIGTVLCRVHSAVEAVYFPLNGMISLVQTLDDGATVEVGIVGREGFFGVPLLHGTEHSPVEALVQGDGIALRLNRKDFIAEVSKNERLRSSLLKYAGALYSQTLQTAACNAGHKVPERLARWLLEAQDRMQRDEFPIRHEFLAYMLCCRRAGVSIAMGALRKAGIVVLGRGKITIADRVRLEAAACSCYAVVRSEFRRLFPPVK